MLEKIFNDFGLTKYETKVYLALIEIGEATTGQILSKANIQSGKIYQILDSLKKKGFVTEIKKNGVKKYFSIEPSKILKFFKEKRNKIDEEETIFKNILPDLIKKINEKKEKIQIEIFTGLEGMKKAFEKEVVLYKRGRPLKINGITDYTKHPKKFVNYFQYNLFSKREKAEVEVMKISDKEAKTNVHEKKSKIRLLEYNSILTFNTIENLTIISVWAKEPLFITIESQEVAKGFRENFDLLWSVAKPLKN